MNGPFKILVDWGSTIIRDEDLFNNIAENSGNVKSKWQSPKSWDKIRQIGGINYFDEIKDRFFIMGEAYPEAIESISSFCCEDGDDSESQVFVIYDNKPEVFKSRGATFTHLAFAWNYRNGSANGLYVDPDKIFIAKSIQVDVIVDDDPRIAIAAAVAGIKVILMLKKWNKNFHIEDLKYSMREEHFEKAKSNISIVEDWYEASIKITSIMDE